MKYDEQIQALLTEHGAVLKRDKRHLVYALPNGNKLTMAKTPSDERSAANALSDLRKLLGVQDPERGKPGERRPRKTAGPERKPRIHAAPQNTALADQLRAHGVEADALREKLREMEGRRDWLLEQKLGLEDDLRKLRDGWVQINKDRDSLLAVRRACWACRLRDWWRNR